MKNIIAVIISLLLVGVVAWWWTDQQKITPLPIDTNQDFESVLSDNEPEENSLARENQNATPTIKKGDRIGDFVVVDVRISHLIGDNYWVGSVQYSGITEIRGTVFKNEMHGNICMSPDDSETPGNIPRVLSQETTWFCFNDSQYHTPDGSVGSVYTALQAYLHSPYPKDRDPSKFVTVRIADYLEIVAEKEAYDTATFLGVIQ
jgi:hypothetical protein